MNLASMPVAATTPVICQPLGRTFDVRDGETILEGALRNGLSLPHSCRNGVCGTCKAKVLEGSVDEGAVLTTGLGSQDRQSGYALLCKARPCGAVTVECDVVAETLSIPVRKLVTRVQSLEKLAPDVMRIRLKLPENQELKFLPGQYINIVMNNGIRRSLSLANPPHESGYLELHLRNYGGLFSQHVFNVMKEMDLVRLEGPLGTFFIRESSNKPIIFVASGTGFAPIKAMVEHHLRQSVPRPITIYWGARRPVDLYLDKLIESWVEKHGIRYVPVVSNALSEDCWKGRTGFVHQAVIQDHPDLTGYQVYACGAPVVVSSARQDFTALCQLPDSEFFADMFVSGTQPTP